MPLFGKKHDHKDSTGTHGAAASEAQNLRQDASVPRGTAAGAGTGATTGMDTGTAPGGGGLGRRNQNAPTNQGQDWNDPNVAGRGPGQQSHAVGGQGADPYATGGQQYGSGGQEQQYGSGGQQRGTNQVGNDQGGLAPIGHHQQRSGQSHNNVGTRAAGKVEHAVGTLVGSSALKARGQEKEQEANAFKQQSSEIAEAERLEREAMQRRERAVAQGAHPENRQLGGPGHQATF